MTNQHPITPPPELIRKWAQCQDLRKPESLWQTIAAKAAQWGADQELEACCQTLYDKYAPTAIAPELCDWLRTARRPKTPSLKEQALGALEHLALGPDPTAFLADMDTIRRALEQLDD